MSRPPPVLHTYVAPTCFIRMSRGLSRLFRALSKCRRSRGLQFQEGACRKGLSRRLVAEVCRERCLSQAERLCYKPYVAERRPGASYIPRLWSRTQICFCWHANSLNPTPIKTLRNGTLLLPLQHARELFTRAQKSGQCPIQCPCR